MYCNKCGAQNDANTNFCRSCGNQLNSVSIPDASQNINQNGTTVQGVSQQTPNITGPSVPYVEPSSTYDSNVSAPTELPANYYVMPKNNNKKWIILGASLGGALLLIIIISFIVIVSKSKSQYYFSDNGYDDGEIVEKKEDPKEEGEVEEEPKVERKTTQKAYRSKTVIEAERTYSGISIAGATDVKSYIVKDSVEQKNQCPEEILAVENEIMTKYGITAVNLCEMDVDFAMELGKVFGEIYNEYPGARGYITNFTLVNFEEAGTIAAFQGVFPFIGQDLNYAPLGIKTIVYLNAPYFLNESSLEYATKQDSASGHFPPNANTRSPVAHELGHFLSYLAAAKHFNVDQFMVLDVSNMNQYMQFLEDRRKSGYTLDMLHEAHENYQRDKNVTIDFDKWRATISGYAVAKDSSEKYLYDETIAEAFHDVYLNGNNAKDASKYIVAVLKKRLGN